MTDRGSRGPPLEEATTDPTDALAQESAYGAARDELTDDQISAVIWGAITMNAFNRLSIMSKHPVRATRTASPNGATGSGDRPAGEEARAFRPGTATAHEGEPTHV